MLGVSIIPPYKTYVLYEVYITPGLCGMILLFSGMQSSLSMVYDREMGNMRTLLVSPFPRWFLLVSKLLAGVTVSIAQVYVFLGIAWFWGVKAPPIGYLFVLPALFLSGMMLCALGLLLSSMIKQLENFAGVMNFVIFPMYFASPALYPLWRIQESSPLLYKICLVNPFTYVVELIRFAFYGQDRVVFARRRRRLHGAVPRRRDHRLRSFARPDEPQAGYRRKRLMRKTSLGRGLALAALLLPAASAALAADEHRSRLALHPAQGAGTLAWPDLERPRTAGIGKGLVEGPGNPRRSSRNWRRGACRSPMRKSEIRDFADQLAGGPGERPHDDAGSGPVRPHERASARRSFPASPAMPASSSNSPRGCARKPPRSTRCATKPDADVNEIALRTDRLTWETRVFEERVQSLTFVCEVPTLIEQRLYALAKTIMEVLAGK